MDTPTDFAPARPRACQRVDFALKRSPTTVNCERTRYVDHHHGQRCWPASAGTSKPDDTRRNTHQTRPQGYKNTHVVLWGTPASFDRRREKFTGRNSRRPCGKLGKPPKPSPQRALDHHRTVQNPSTGCTRLHVHPVRGHGQGPAKAPVDTSRSLDTRGVATAKPQLFPPYSTTLYVVFSPRAAFRERGKTDTG